MPFSARFLETARQAIDELDVASIEAVVREIAALRERAGRLFVLGVGGSAANAAHAVNDFRKLCAIEAYAPTDNVAELTARTNDEGWDTTFSAWLTVSRLSSADLVFVFSVGGGDAERNVSPNLVRALELARERKTPIVGVVGRDGGATRRAATACVLVPNVAAEWVTPLTEAFQALLLHLIVSHPDLRVHATKW